MFVAYDLNNASARATRNATRFQRAMKTGKLDGKKIKCEWEDHTSAHPCSGEIRIYPIYDLFNDKPVDVMALCDHHDGYYGRPSEGYFECDDCQHVYPENSSWQKWVVETEAGTLCLNCARHRALNDPKNWVDLIGEVQEINLRERSAGHLYAVEHGNKDYLKDGLIEFGYVETLGDGESAVNLAVQKKLQEAKSAGHEEAIIVLSAAYQFSVTFSIFVRLGTSDNYNGYRVCCPTTGSSVVVFRLGEGFSSKRFMFKRDDADSRNKAFIRAYQWINSHQA